MATSNAQYDHYGSGTLGVGSCSRVPLHSTHRGDGAVWLACVLEMALPPHNLAAPAVDGRAAVTGISGLIPSACSHSLPNVNRVRPTPSETKDPVPRPSSTPSSGNRPIWLVHKLRPGERARDMCSGFTRS